MRLLVWPKTTMEDIHLPSRSAPAESSANGSSSSSLGDTPQEQARSLAIVRPHCQSLRSAITINSACVAAAQKGN